MTDAAYPPISCTLWVCEDCGSFTDDLVVSMRLHVGHHVTGIRGDDYDHASRVAASHIVLAQHIRSGTTDTGTLGGEMHAARIYADWFSEEDSIYDDDDAANR